MSIFDEYATDYDSWFVENDLIYDAEVNAIRKLIQNDKEYVEVGVGTGLFASRLGIKKGIEPSKSMANIAVKRGIDVVEGVAEKLPLEDNSVEGILMVTVDCFIKDIMPVFNEAFRVLQNGGCYIIAFIDRDTPLGEGYEKNKEDSVYYKGATFRSSSEMKSLLKKAGFKIVKSKQTVYTLNNEIQPIRCGNGEGVFAVVKAKKEI